MSNQQMIGVNLSEDLITLLCWDDSHGKLVAGMVDAALFPGDYAMIAERAIKYWSEYKQAPKDHIVNLIAPELEAGGGRSHHLQRILQNMEQIHPGINAEFVVNQITTFVRGQQLNDTILRAAQLVSNHAPVAEIEQLLDAGLRQRVLRFERGSRLDDDLGPFLDYLNKQHNEFFTGIKELDRAGIVPARGEIMLLVAGKGRGKTWFMVNVGRENIARHQRVLHLSLEMSEMEMRQRYYQCLFAAPKHQSTIVDEDRLKDEYLNQGLSEVEAERRAKATAKPEPGLWRPTLARACKVCGHADNELSAYLLRLRRPSREICRCGPDRQRLEVVDAKDFGSRYDFAFKSPQLRGELESRIPKLGFNAANLLIKRFPNRSLTVDGFAAYLDYLADGPDHFVPDLVCLDYARLLQQNARSAADWRISIGQNMELLRALAIERNFALVTADQLNRKGHSLRTARSHHVGEDWSQVHTADITLIHSATEAEQQRGFVRIFVDHARSEQDKIEVVVAQNLAIGQFHLDSARKPSDWDTIMPQQTADSSDADVDNMSTEELVD